MKVWLLAIAGALVISALPAADADAHGRRYVSTHVNVGFGIGRAYGYRHRPYRAYPRSYVGVSLWPRERVTRVRTRERTRSVDAMQLYVYPAAGQSESRLANDRYDCHVWAIQQTDFDPSLGAGTESEARDYARAMTACLEARNYVVR